MILRKCAVVCLLAAFSIGAAFAQTFNREQYALPSDAGPVNQVDLNGDGVPDMIMAASDGFYVVLSNGDGSFQAARSYGIGLGSFKSFALEDFNRDGFADVLAAGTNGIYFFAGHSDGSLSPGILVTSFQQIATPQLAISDFNRDGKLDLVYSSSYAGYNHVYVSLGNGNGTFGPTQQIFVGPSTGYEESLAISALLTGDIDGDAKADVVVDESDFGKGGCGGLLHIYYGNGAGGFTRVDQPLSSCASYATVADVNSDGRSDIIASTYPTIEIYRGSATRSLSRLTINPDAPWQPSIPIPADFNGDGIADIAALGSDGGNQSVLVFLGKADGSYNTSPFSYPMGSVYNNERLAGLLMGRYNQDQKPDLATAQPDRSTLNVLLNTTSGKFASCTPPGRYGIHVCSATMSTSPMRFNIAASSFSPLRKIEIWVDGVKKAQTFNSWSTYSFADQSIPLAAGSHNVSVYAATYDNRLQRKAFTVSVTGSTCSQPSSATATVICSPANGSTVTSPVSVQARGGSSVTFMEVWVDGAKRFQTSGNAISTSISLAAGSHHMTVFGKGGGTVLSKAISDFTVK